jgi:hypothetical protein
MSSPRLVDVDLIRDLLEPLGDSAAMATPSSQLQNSPVTIGIAAVHDSQ